MIQDNVRSAWEDGLPVVISIESDNLRRNYLVYPAEMVLEQHIAEIRKITPAKISIVLPFEVMKVLRLPSRVNLMKAAASTYNILSNLLKEEEDSLFSISVSSTEYDANDMRSKALADAVYRLSDIYYQYVQTRDKAEFRESIVREFKTPGCLPLLFASPLLLRSKYSVEDLSLALCDLQRRQQIAVIAEIVDEDMQPASSDSLVVEEGERIKNLWRAYYKISAADMARP